MKQFNTMDVYAIQECLMAYKVLLNWIPSTTQDEVDLKYDKIKTILHLAEKCDDILEEMNRDE